MRYYRTVHRIKALQVQSEWNPGLASLHQDIIMRIVPTLPEINHVHTMWWTLAQMPVVLVFLPIIPGSV